MSKRLLCQTILTLTFVFHLETSGYGRDESCVEGLAAYETTLLRFVRERTPCVNCHSGRRAGAPVWANVASNLSHQLARGFVNFANPSLSPLVARAGNSHCGPACKNAQLQFDLTEQIKAWWDSGEKECYKPQVSASANVPEGLTSEPRSISWRLVESSVQLEITSLIRKLGDGESISGYVLSKFKIKSTGHIPVRLKRLLFEMNVRPVTKLTMFDSLDTVLGAMSEYTDDASHVLIESDGLQSDVISIGFGKVEIGQ